MTPPTDATALQLVIDMAVILHARQSDLAGVPYIAHPLAVMRRVSPCARRVALAHDWKEDCGVTDAVLHHLHFTSAEIEAVDLLTRRKGEGYDRYIESIITGTASDEAREIAIEVKIADLADNLDEQRWQVAQETSRDEKRREKYVRAYELLVGHQATAAFGGSGGSTDKETESVMQDTTEHDHRDDPTTSTTSTTPTPVITYPVLNDADLYAARLTAHEIHVDNRTYRWSYIPKYGVTVVMLSGYPYSAYFTLPADFTSIYLLTAAIRAYDAGWRAGHSHGVDYGKEQIGRELRKLIGCAAETG